MALGRKPIYGKRMNYTVSIRFPDSIRAWLESKVTHSLTMADVVREAVAAKYEDETGRKA